MPAGAPSWRGCLAACPTHSHTQAQVQAHTGISSCCIMHYLSRPRTVPAQTPARRTPPRDPASPRVGMHCAPTRTHTRITILAQRVKMSVTPHLQQYFTTLQRLHWRNTPPLKHALQREPSWSLAATMAYGRVENTVVPALSARAARVRRPASPRSTTDVIQFVKSGMLLCVRTCVLVLALAIAQATCDGAGTRPFSIFVAQPRRGPRSWAARPPSGSLNAFRRGVPWPPLRFLPPPQPSTSARSHFPSAWQPSPLESAPAGPV